MRLFRRSRDDMGTTGPALLRGERVLAKARTIDGANVTATEQALLLDRDDAGRPLRLPWESITHAEWLDDDAVLEIDESSSESGSLLRHRLRMAESGFLPETVRERVMASIVVSQHVRLAGARGVQIVARRGAAGGDPWWQLIFDRGLDSADPMIQSRAQSALDHLREQTLG